MQRSKTLALLQSVLTIHMDFNGARISFRNKKNWKCQQSWKSVD